MSDEKKLPWVRKNGNIIRLVQHTGIFYEYFEYSQYEENPVARWTMLPDDCTQTHVSLPAADGGDPQQIRFAAAVAGDRGYSGLQKSLIAEAEELEKRMARDRSIKVLVDILKPDGHTSITERINILLNNYDVAITAKDGAKA